ncbi:MAG TPA: glycosyltransferase family A protein [Pyrinomonadaceae bacterium]|nr:glycosyltransferase family A protein [Pyrinomonadaceae bacterium]
MQPVVSVIVPAHNYGHFIGATLDSLAAQTFTNWECIVVDDGSTDNTSEVVQAYAQKDARVRYVRQENLKQAAARNNGIQHSNGKYFQFLDADDRVERRKLESQVAYLDRYPKIDIVYGDARFFPSESPSELMYSMWGDDVPWQPGVSGCGRDVLLSLLQLNNILINAALTRRSIIDRVGLFDETLPPVEDWDLWLRCAEAGACFHFSDAEGTLALVRSHSSSSSKSRVQFYSSTLLMRKKLAARLTDAEARRKNAELLAETEGTLGAEHVLHDNRARGIYHLARAAVLDRKLRHRLKWFACALVAPFGRQRFEKVYSSSISRTVMRPLTQFQEEGRR